MRAYRRRQRRSSPAPAARDFDPALPAVRLPARRRARSHGLGAAGALRSRITAAACSRPTCRATAARRRAARLDRRDGRLDRGADRRRRRRARRGSSAIPWARWWRSKPPRATPTRSPRSRLIATAAPMRGLGRSARRRQGQRPCRHRHDLDLGPRLSRRPSAARCVPGLWMLGGGERLLERAAPGVMFADLAACNDYQRRARRRGQGDRSRGRDPGQPRSDDAGEERQARRRRYARLPRSRCSTAPATC